MASVNVMVGGRPCDGHNAFVRVRGVSSRDCVRVAETRKDVIVGSRPGGGTL